MQTAKSTLILTLAAFLAGPVFPQAKKSTCPQKVVDATSRRTFLKYSIGALAGLAGVGYGVHRWNQPPKYDAAKYQAWIAKYLTAQKEVRTARDGEDAYEIFLRRFGAQTPFEAAQVKIENAFGLTNYILAAEGNDIRELSATFQNFKAFDYNDPRNRIMSDKMRDLVERNPKDNLLIIYAGYSHVLQYFVETRDTRSVYVSYGVNKDTPHGTAFSNVFRKGEKTDNGAQKIAPLLIHVAATDHIFQQSKRAPTRIEDFLTPELPSKSSNVIFVGDTHGVRDVEGLAKALPSAAYWKERGFRSVTFAAEGATIGDDRREAVIEQVYPKASLQPTFEEHRRVFQGLKALPPEVFEKMKQDPEMAQKLRQLEEFERLFEMPAPWFLPELYDLVLKVDSYAPDLTVRYVGIDPDP